MTVKTTLQDEVLQILGKYPSARNSDLELILRLLLEKGLAERTENGIHIKYAALQKMPAFESITRARRKWQEAGLYQATEEVKQKRDEREKEYKHINLWF